MISLYSLVIATLVSGALGHGRVRNPPSRAIQWREEVGGWPSPPDYNDDQSFCGGLPHMIEQGYKCGICGDPYDGPYEHEAPGGQYANGNIVREYQQGQWISLETTLTTSHLGYFEVKICPNNDVAQDPTQECFEKYGPLEMRGSEGSGLKYPIPEQGTYNDWDLEVKLPSDLACSQCILQWRYTSGNNWGTGPPNCPEEEYGPGCGFQETFMACSDVAIRAPDGSYGPTTTTASSSTQSSTTTGSSSCPGGDLATCISLCPTDQTFYKPCVDNCVAAC